MIKKIAVIANFFPPYIIGGAELVVKNIVEEFVKKNIEVVVICMSERLRIEKEQKTKNYSIYRFFPANFYFPYSPYKRIKILKIFWWILNLWNPYTFFVIRKIIKNENPEMIHVHNFYGLSVSVFTAIRSLGKPVLFFPHDFYLVCKNSSFIKNNGEICKKQCFLCRIFTFWNKLFLPKKLNVVFLSRFSSDILKKYHKLEGPVIHNACMLTEEKIYKNIEYRKSKKQNERLIFLFMGRLDRHKGILTLLNAWSKIKNPDISLYIAGVGEYQKVVEELAKKDLRVKYFGFVSGEKKEQIYLESDVFMLPSECFEVSPLTIQEAYGYGLPVLGTNFGSIPEHIEIDKTGWLFELRNSEDLARKIEMIYKKIDMLEEMRENCFNYALGNTLSKFIKKILLQ